MLSKFIAISKHILRHFKSTAEWREEKMKQLTKAFPCDAIDYCATFLIACSFFDEI